MAIYRNVHLNFWTDDKVEEMVKDEKYFFLYLLTNPHTNLIGCYQLTIRQIMNETFLSENEILELFENFAIYEIAKYDKNTKEIFIKNWNKYNWTKSIKLHKPIIAEVNKIKSLEFKKELASIVYRYGIDTTDLICSVTDTDLIKNKYSELQNVRLTENEYYKLIEKLGNKNTTNYIEKVSLYIESKGKSYKSHYATILNWYKKDHENDIVPEWFNQEIKKEELSEDEERELESIINGTYGK